MPRGYAVKFLDVNLSTDKIGEQIFGDEILRGYVGGRGLAAKICGGLSGEDVDSTS